MSVSAIYVLLVELSLLIFGLYVINHIRGRFHGIATAWTDGTIPIVIGILTFHLGLRLRWPAFWMSLYQERGFVWFQLIIAIGARVATVKKKSVKLIGVAVTIVGMIGALVNVINAKRNNDEADKIIALNSPGIATRQSNIGLNNPLPALAVNQGIQTAVEEFWRKNLSAFPAQAMIRIAREKSNYNQFETDGRNPYRGRKNWKNVGVMGINEDSWLEKSKALDYNIYELDGNLNMALWMYRNYGFEPWKEPPAIAVRPIQGSASLVNREVTIVAPVGVDNWSEKISTLPGPTSFAPSGLINIMPDGNPNRIIASYPGARFDIGRTKFVQFQSRIKEPVNVTVSR